MFNSHIMVTFRIASLMYVHPQRHPGVKVVAFILVSLRTLKLMIYQVSGRKCYSRSNVGWFL